MDTDFLYHVTASRGCLLSVYSFMVLCFDIIWSKKKWLVKRATAEIYKATPGVTRSHLQVISSHRTSITSLSILTYQYITYQIYDTYCPTLMAYATEINLP